MTTFTVTGGPWPDRIGLTARIVPAPAAVYPWKGKLPSEVVVFIENDPLTVPCFGVVHDPTWTCVMDRRNLS